MPLLPERRSARVVTVGSGAHAMGRLENGHGRLDACSRSKPARGSLVVNPGATATSVIAPGPFTRPLTAFMRLTLAAGEGGALLSLRRERPGARGGLCVGPGVLTPCARARDESLARRPWNVSGELTGVRFTALASRP
ncbi:hypothetical protein [Streptosporangium saharense]|uniref:hypothetical protein n=1 Tax=Streptosporangium saharense TaxID=1706840 RepID=UPI00342E7D17